MYACVLSVLSAHDAVKPHLSYLIDSESGSIESFSAAIFLEGEAVHSHIVPMHCCHSIYWQ